LRGLDGSNLDTWRFAASGELYAPGRAPRLVDVPEIVVPIGAHGA
jgi:hypothetical protein